MSLCSPTAQPGSNGRDARIITPPQLPAGPSPPSSTNLELDAPEPPDSSPAASHGSWWFDGTGAKHDDWFLDLKGNKTDHLPDVRTYLIAVGSGGKPSSSQATREEQDQWRLEHGKELLLEHWRRGDGYFIDPSAPGRDYTNVSQTEGLPGLGVPWYWDLRNTLETAKDENAQLPEYGDVGFRYAPPPGADRRTAPMFIYHGPPRVTQEPLIKTNLRCPLPWQQYTMHRPEDTEWRDFICDLYCLDVHPAADAIGTLTANNALNCDVRRYNQLDYKGFLTIDWSTRFDEYPDWD